MAPDPSGPRLSKLDSERFGIVAARLDVLTPETLPATLAFCAERHVKLLIANARAEEHAAVYAAQQQRFEVMDVILVFERRFGTEPLPEIDASVEIRPFAVGEEAAISELGRLSFEGYVGHYQADPRLDPARTAEIYPDWTRRLLASRDVDHEVLVAVSGGQIVGFHALERRDQCVFLPLSGVRRGIHGKHVYQAMNTRGMEWSVARGARTTVGAVQIANPAIQRALVRLGYLPDHSYYTFHKWFD